MADLPDSRVVHSREAISHAVNELAKKLGERCAGREWIAICVMHGGLIFAGELLQRLSVKLKQDFVRVTRYRDTTSAGALEWVVYPETNLTGKNVLLIDDIYDEGNTLSVIVSEFKNSGAADVVCVALVDKMHDRKIDGFKPDFVGLQCADEYVFGYGMDIEGYWRNLPEIRALN
ncbi:MAG TPA: hypoxanthine-guanine phosphoribosyltransferase [Gammaproteobacteria bacterium]|nr:hypoxanthine-guanine phosphoribosyltransferase [Gammaproteobacteria bacterium]|tara:strand:- start:180 stop:704 length:525 start_codon:yes stop_codon:yes gene_type:complete